MCLGTFLEETITLQLQFSTQTYPGDKGSKNDHIFDKILFVCNGMGYEGNLFLFVSLSIIKILTLLTNFEKLYPYNIL